MKYYIEILDWRATSFKHVRNILDISRGEALEMIDGPYTIDDLIDSEYVDSNLPVKKPLANLYNELLIGDWNNRHNSQANCRLHSEYVNYKQLI